MIYLYIINDLLNSKVYIGQTVRPEKRWTQHKTYAKREKPIQYIHRAIAKYGVENFEFIIIAICLTTENANETEKILIEQYRSRDNKFGYNVAPGGDTPWNLGLPKELNPLTGIPRSEETKKKISEGNLGKIMPPCSEERKIHMSNLYKNRPLSAEWKDKIRIANSGKIPSESSRIKMSLAHVGLQSGENHPMAKLTWEIVDEIREEYKSNSITQKELAKRYDVSKATISDIIQNKIWKV